MLKESTSSYIAALVLNIPIFFQLQNDYFGLGRNGVIAKYYRESSPEIFWGMILLQLILVAGCWMNGRLARKKEKAKEIKEESR